MKKIYKWKYVTMRIYIIKYTLLLYSCISIHKNDNQKDWAWPSMLIIYTSIENVTKKAKIFLSNYWFEKFPFPDFSYELRVTNNWFQTHDIFKFFWTKNTTLRLKKFVPLEKFFWSIDFWIWISKFEFFNEPYNHIWILITLKFTYIVHDRLYICSDLVCLGLDMQIFPSHPLQLGNLKLFTKHYYYYYAFIETQSI